MTDAEALEQAQTWLFSSADTGAPTEAIARLLTLATASIANTIGLDDVSQQLDEARRALNTLGISGGSADGVSMWWRIAPDNAETAHPTADAAAAALWSSYQAAVTRD